MTHGGPAPTFRPALTTAVLGRPLRHYPIAVTTEALALAWARREDAPEGATVVADQEISPRQRKGPPWVGFSTRGLYLSVVLRPGLPPEGEGLLWLLASLGAAEGLEAVVGAPVSLKWPDDVLAGGGKIAGVKVDAQLGPGQIQTAIVTFRINVNVERPDLPADLGGRATSVAIETGAPVTREAVLDAVLGAFERRYDDDVPALLDGYRARCESLGRSVRALLLPRGEVTGTAVDVDAFGALLVDGGGAPTAVAVDVLKKLEYLVTSGS
ncbi:MAG: biotin--[acetyl-CoA-carboxylase] ligase [Actinomycetota bacterium]